MTARYRTLVSEELMPEILSDRMWAESNLKPIRVLGLQLNGMVLVEFEDAEAVDA